MKKNIIAILLFLFFIGIINGQTSSDRWSEKASMPTARAFAHAIIFGDKIYVFGGQSIDPATGNRTATNKVYAYTPKDVVKN